MPGKESKSMQTIPSKTMGSANGDGNAAQRGTRGGLCPPKGRYQRYCGVGQTMARDVYPNEGAVEGGYTSAHR